MKSWDMTRGLGAGVTLGVAVALACLGSEGLAAQGMDIRRDATVIAVEAVLPSVVNISTKTQSQRSGYYYDWFRDFWSPFVEQLPPQTSAGSGVIVDEEGYVLTNVHVVEGANEISVKLSNGRVLPAQIVSGLRRSDVALLKLQGNPGEKFIPIRFAADDDLLLGETVLALGNPFGLGASVSKGILSAKTRRAANEQGFLEVEDWLQTDASINPGNSGGPLVNLKGELIGLSVAVYKEGQGIGFAIPAKRLNEALGDMFTPEDVRSLWFGGHVQTSSTGLVLQRVEVGSPADSAGLRKGDVVLKVNNRPVRNLFSFNRELINIGDTQQIPIQVQRANEKKIFTVQMVAETSFFNAELIRKKLGCTVQDLTPEIAARAGLNAPDGVIVTAVEKGSPAAEAGLQRGMIWLGINNQSIDGVTSSAKFLHGLKRGAAFKANIVLTRPLRRGVVELRVRQ